MQSKISFKKAEAFLTLPINIYFFNSYIPVDLPQYCCVPGSIALPKSNGGLEKEGEERADR
jgi:hypothetical protein